MNPTINGFLLNIMEPSGQSIIPICHIVAVEPTIFGLAVTLTPSVVSTGSCACCEDPVTAYFLTFEGLSQMFTVNTTGMQIMNFTNATVDDVGEGITRFNIQNGNRDVFVSNCQVERIMPM
jgi:hypothetical protein